MKKLILGIIGCLLLFAGCNQSTGDETDIIVEEEIISEVEEVVPINADSPELFVGQTMLISPDRSGVTFTCNAESADGTISYQWYKSLDGKEENKVAIDGANAASYTTEDFIEKEIRYYFCTVTNTITDNGDSGVKTNSQTTAFYAAYTGLPTLYLNTGDVPTSAITKEEYVLGTFKLMGEGITTVEYTFEKNKEGIKGRGNSSWHFPKKGYNLKFDTRQSFFNLPSSKKWCIVSNYIDTTYLHNKYASILGNEIFNSTWNASFNYVDVIINGEYMGNYIFCEKNTLEENRINIQDISDCTNKKIASGKYTDKNDDGDVDLEDGGFILEIDYRGDADFAFYTNKNLLVTLKEPDEVSEDVQNMIAQITNDAEDLLYSNQYCDTEELNGLTISKWMRKINIDSVIDWYIVNEFAKQLDSTFITSVYVYYDPTDGQLHMGPNWDFDNSFGNWHRDPYEGESPDGWYTHRADGMFGLQPVNWIARMSEDELFSEYLKNRWNSKKSTLLMSINSNLEDVADDIEVSAEFDFIKWYPNLCGSYKTIVRNMKNWCNSRYSWLDWAINSL